MLDDDYYKNRYEKYRGSLSLYTDADLKHMERFPLSIEQDDEYYITHRGADEKAENKPEFSDSFIEDINEIIRMVEQSENTDKRPKER